MKKRNLIISVMICLAAAIVATSLVSFGGMSRAKSKALRAASGQVGDTGSALAESDGDRMTDGVSAETVVFALSADADTAANAGAELNSPDERLGEEGTEPSLTAGNNMGDDTVVTVGGASYREEEKLNYSFSMDAFTGRNRMAQIEEEEEDEMTFGFGSTEADVVLSLLSDADNIASYGQTSEEESDEEAHEAALETKEQKLKKKLDEIPLPQDVPSSLTYVYNKSFRMKISDNERNILYRIVQAEAGDQDIYGRILVANVILNRVLDDGFKDYIEGVVFEKIGGATQFAPTKDGRFYTVTVTSKTIEAVDRALRGEDYSKGALYFFQRNLTTSSKASWFDNSLHKLFKYGSHEFYKEK